VSENRVLRRIFRRKREEVVEGWRRQHNEELRNLYALPDVRVIKSRRMRWVVYVTRTGEMNAYSSSVGKSEGNLPLGSAAIDGKIILDWTLGN
jgi:hypothetical protein